MNCDSCREALREHALGLLESEASAAIEAHLADCEACAAALEKEEARLNALDALPDVDAPPELAAKTVERILVEAKVHAPKKQFPRVAIFALAAAAVLIVVLAPSLARHREAARRGSSANNLKQIGIVFKMYSNESKGGVYPPPVRVGNTFVPDLRVLFPRFMNDPRVLINPRHPDADALNEELLQALESAPPDWDTAHRVIAKSYNYLPWAMQEESDLMLLAQRMPELEDGALDMNLEEPDHETLYRLKDGIERFFITDINNPAGSAMAQSTIPVLFEVVPAPEDAKRSLGCNVLFMDGHVEFIKYGEKFPVLPETRQVLGSTE